MKVTLFLLTLFGFNCAHAETKTASAADICSEAASSWALKSEAKQTKSKAEKIKDIERQALGNGANLYLMSIFVEGPNTGDNTHWEIVGEFNPKNSSCKVLLGKRYWAH